MQLALLAYSLYLLKPQNFCETDCVDPTLVYHALCNKNPIYYSYKQKRTVESGLNEDSVITTKNIENQP